MKEKYKRLGVKIIDIVTNARLLNCSVVGGNKNITHYGCPIKPGVECVAYDENMQDFKETLNYCAKHKINRTFITDITQYCPRKKMCPIYKEWVDQKTR